ncbi:hypothetical protein FACS1894166_11260 [Bacilli bacterium]|nr:hypothetical protein FACS1894166_11260 [Bacilli bacterium]
MNSPDREFSLNVSGIIKSSTVYFDMNIPNQPTASVSIKTGLPALGPNDEVTFQVDTTATNMVGYT